MVKRRHSSLATLGNMFSKRNRSKYGLVRLAPAISSNKRKGQMSDYFKLANRMGLRRYRGDGLVKRAAISWEDRLSPTERAQIRHEIDEAMDEDTELQAVKADYKLRQSSSWWYKIVYLLTKRYRKPVL